MLYEVITGTVNTLRLWSAVAYDEFGIPYNDLQDPEKQAAIDARNNFV